MTSDLPLLDLLPLVRGRLVLAADDETRVLGPGQTPMRHLTSTELATLALYWDDDAPVCDALSVPVQAALRARIFAHRNGMHALRGWKLAYVLHDSFYATVQPRTPWRGFDLLRLIDATADRHGVHVYVGTDHGEQRLTDRMTEMGWSA